ncbi:hypothetical protein MTO96_022474 [Rhipicephalus appendiculatus]
MPVKKFPLLLMLALIIMVENVSNRRMNPPGPDCVGLPCSRPNDPWCGPHCFCFRRAGGLPECKARRSHHDNVGSEVWNRRNAHTYNHGGERISSQSVHPWTRLRWYALHHGGEYLECEKAPPLAHVVLVFLATDHVTADHTATVPELASDVNASSNLC